MRPAGGGERRLTIAIWGGALLGFGLGGLLDAAVRPVSQQASIPDWALVDALARLRDAPAAMSLLGIALMLPALSRVGRGGARLLAGALLIGAGLFGTAVGLSACIVQPGLVPGSAALLIWSVALVAGGQCLFERGEHALPPALRPVVGRIGR